MGKRETADPSIGRGAALLIIDMISTMDFEHADQIADAATAAARSIKKLRAAMTRAGFPVIYVNDNFGHWELERQGLVALCEKSGDTASRIVRILRPRKSDLFIIKPMHSGFYATNLQAVLPRLGVGRLILTGMAADLCVLFTAADAHMRDYDLWVPEDCVAAPSQMACNFALGLLRRHMNAEIRPASELSVPQWLNG